MPPFSFFHLLIKPTSSTRGGHARNGHTNERPIQDRLSRDHPSRDRPSRVHTPSSPGARQRAASLPGLVWIHASHTDLQEQPGYIPLGVNKARISFLPSLVMIHGLPVPIDYGHKERYASVFCFVLSLKTAMPPFSFFIY
jgi:hypothetical protein